MTSPSRKLVLVNPQDRKHCRFLYELLGSRPPYANISHTKMPSYKKHLAFVRSNPYKAWYLIEDVSHGYSGMVGAVYVTKANEIGIAVLEAHRRGGFGFWAVREVMNLHPAAAFYANIAPANEGSKRFFERLGFRCCQHTFRYRG
jgi:RimJ/RimL family protein N-acetyltransferase